MNRIQIVCYIVAASQLALGALYLFVPAAFISWQGLSPVPADTGYPLAMLAGRFIVYGVGMIAIARQPQKYRFWLDGMIAIQAIDFLAGLGYTFAGVVTLEISGIAMFDAALFMALMLWVRRSIPDDSSSPAHA